MRYFKYMYKDNGSIALVDISCLDKPVLQQAPGYSSVLCMYIIHSIIDYSAYLNELISIQTIWRVRKNHTQILMKPLPSMMGFTFTVQ